MAISNSYNFQQVNERLTTSGVVGANRLKGLAAEGYELVINLLPDSSEHAVIDEQAIVEGQGVAYVAIPVEWEQPTLADYQQFAEIMDAAASKKVHVHCAANYRVSGFYALYAVAKGDWSAQQADDFVQRLWNPALFPQWVALMEQVKAAVYQTVRWRIRLRPELPRG